MAKKTLRVGDPPPLPFSKRRRVYRYTFHTIERRVGQTGETLDCKELSPGDEYRGRGVMAVERTTRWRASIRRTLRKKQFYRLIDVDVLVKAKED